MRPLLWDHLVAALLVVIAPIHGWFSYRKFAAKVAAGIPDLRITEYRWTIALEWAAVALVVVLWAIAARPIEALGVTLPLGWGSVIGGAITAAVLAFMLVQWQAVGRLDQQGKERLERQLSGAAALIPRTESEHRVFRWLAITAGICEELLYRGYLIWYFGNWVGPWAAAAVGAVVFGLGHFYQGPAGVVKTGGVGLLAGLLYLATGSLLWPMILHAVVDLQGGAIGRKILGQSAAAAP
jgi:membrane protease YdiL (CAAX protease family)